MTTIAFRDGVIASDSIAVEDDMITQVVKIHRSRGCIIGLAGDFYAGYLFLEWFEENEDGENRPGASETGDFSAIVLFPDGRLYTCDGHYVLAPELSAYYAIGSGAAYAMSAMKLGLSAEAAVAHAIGFDVNSGGEVKTMRLEDGS